MDSLPSMAAAACDILIIGAGRVRGVVAKELAGARVLRRRAGGGAAVDPATDLQNSRGQRRQDHVDRAAAYAGQHGVVPKTGVGVGGGTLAWLGVMPRFHPADFRTHSTEGVGDDWPIGYDDLRPHYEKVEREFGVAGECGPFAPEPYELPMPPHRMNWHAQVLARGARQARRAAVRAAGRHQLGRLRRPARRASTAAGAASGCPTGAKATAADTYPRARGAGGARVISEAFVHRDHLRRGDAAASTGVEYLDAAGREHASRPGWWCSPPTPSRRRGCCCSRPTPTFPDGLANSSGAGRATA